MDQMNVYQFSYSDNSFAEAVRSLNEIWSISLTCERKPMFCQYMDKSTILNNYRPVSLLSIASKVFERIIFKYIYSI